MKKIGIIIAFVIILLVIQSCVPQVIPSPDAFLFRYIDANYSVRMDSTHQPDYSVIDWQPDPMDSPYRWQRGILTLYLWNTYHKTIKVHAGINPNTAQPGIDIHSDTKTILSNGRAPLDITIEIATNLPEYPTSFGLWWFVTLEN